MGEEPVHQDRAAGQLHAGGLLPRRHPEEQEREGAHFLGVPGGGVPGQHAALRGVGVRRRLRFPGKLFIWNELEFLRFPEGPLLL